MNQPARLQHVHRSVLRPPIQVVPIYALVGRGVSYRDPIVGAPFESDQADITVAHGALTQEIDTML